MPLRLRPAPAHWFETYVPREQTVYALEALAASGHVELELDARLARPLDPRPVRPLVDACQALRRDYRGQLPAPAPAPGGLVDTPEQIATEALQRLRAWCEPVARLCDKQLRLEARRQNLLLLYECLTALHENVRDLARLAHRSRFLYKGVFACPRGSRLCPSLCAAIDEFVPGPEHNFFIVADLPERRAIIETAYQSTACLALDIPDWMSPYPAEQRAQISAKVRTLDAEIHRVGKALEDQRRSPGLAAALARVDLLAWYLERAHQLTGDSSLCHVTGWTDSADVQDLQTAFDAAGIRAAIRFAEPPAFSHPPVSMRLSPWARPFHLFVDMLGTPDSGEVDPSGLLPVIVPLLFGYMFPDLGHGLLLALFAALLYRRWPDGRFLVPCGLSAAAFGVLFGEVFGLEGVLQPLWIRPMEAPLEVLLAPLGLGVALIALGLVFSGIQAHWQARLGDWLAQEAPLLLLYLAAVAALFEPRALWLAPAALLWFLGAQLAERGAHLGERLGHLLHGLFELALNTFSFLRVGAFALGHAGLSLAILHLASAVQDPTAHGLVMLLGHLLIIGIEGLVVFVQTTRLVLFEFFIQFLRGQGRVLRPMDQPHDPHAAPY